MRAKREECRLSQARLADLVGVDSNTISRWERNLFKVTADYVPKLAAALNTSVAYLLGETDNPTRYSSLLLSGPDGHTGNDPLLHASEEQKKITAAQHRRLLRLNDPPFELAPIAAACDEVKAHAVSIPHQDRVTIAGILKSTLDALESAEPPPPENPASAGAAG